MPRRSPFRPRIQDPGAKSLLMASPWAMSSSVMAKLREDATPVVSDTVVKDPDGFFIQLVPGGAGAKLSLTVDSMDR